MSFISIIALYTGLLFHPFFISMTEINHNEKNKMLEVSVRIFADDLEKSLKKSCNCMVDLRSENEKEKVKRQVSNYLAQHLQIKVDGKLVPLEYLGFQFEAESIWSFLQVKDVAAVGEIEIRNSILHDYTNEQINMLRIRANGKDRSEKLDFPYNKFTSRY